MSKHSWREDNIDISVGYDKLTDRFFLIIDVDDDTIEDKPVDYVSDKDVSTFDIYVSLCIFGLKIPINMVAVLEQDKEFEIEKNSILPDIDYGPPPKFLVEHRIGPKPPERRAKPRGLRKPF